MTRCRAKDPLNCKFHSTGSFSSITVRVNSSVPVVSAQVAPLIIYKQQINPSKNEDYSENPFENSLSSESKKVNSDNILSISGEQEIGELTAGVEASIKLEYLSLKDQLGQLKNNNVGDFDSAEYIEQLIEKIMEFVFEIINTITKVLTATTVLPFIMTQLNALEISPVANIPFMANALEAIIRNKYIKTVELSGNFDLNFTVINNIKSFVEILMEPISQLVDEYPEVLDGMEEALETELFNGDTDQLILSNLSKDFNLLKFAAEESGALYITKNTNLTDTFIKSMDSNFSYFEEIVAQVDNSIHNSIFLSSRFSLICENNENTLFAVTLQKDIVYVNGIFINIYLGAYSDSIIKFLIREPYVDNPEITMYINRILFSTKKKIEILEAFCSGIRNTIQNQVASDN